jgi:hypothetical protein
LDSVANIVRSGECVRSLQHRGILFRVIHESDALKIVRTDIDPGSAFDNLELGDSPAYHLVLDGNLVFHAANGLDHLMSGDSIVFSDERPYTVSNNAPSRSVILTVLFRGPNRDARS